MFMISVNYNRCVLFGNICLPINIIIHEWSNATVDVKWDIKTQTDQIQEPWLWYNICRATMIDRLILGLHPANKRRRYKATPSLISWTQTKNQSSLAFCSTFEEILKGAVVILQCIINQSVITKGKHDTQIVPLQRVSDFGQRNHTSLFFWYPMIMKRISIIIRKFG